MLLFTCTTATFSWIPPTLLGVSIVSLMCTFCVYKVSGRDLHQCRMKHFSFKYYSRGAIILSNTALGFKPQFSGHETFALRQLWLPKMARFISDLAANGETTFPSVEDCIIELGVGKNMISAMRWWAEVCGVVEPGQIALTPAGNLFFGPNGKDTAAEDPATLWFLHWHLASTPNAFTTVWFFFNALPNKEMDRAGVLEALKAFVAEHGFKATELTLKRSIEVVLRSYLPHLGSLSSRNRTEDLLEPCLAELDLLDVKSRDVFGFHLGDHPSLPDEIFAYSLVDYWQKLENAGTTLDFNRIVYGSGSPGRIFRLDAISADKRLSKLEEVTDGALRWTEQAGLKQVMRTKDALEDPQAFCTRMINAAFEGK